MKEIPENLSNEGVTRIKLYYHNTRLFGNIFTACLLLGEDDELLARGVAICSLKDIHKKSSGKNIAIGRAIKALKKKENSEEINPERPILDKIIVKKINVNSPFYADIINEADDNGLDYKVIKYKGEDHLRVEIPSFIPVDETYQFFEYKSEYKPTITPDEVRIIGKKKLIN
jgi:hypothetical protein